MIYTCCDPHRRAKVDEHPTLNGIDWLEVLDRDAGEAGLPRQRALLVRLLKPVPADLGKSNVRIVGGERVRNVRVEWVARADAPPAGETDADFAQTLGLEEADHVLLVRTDREGDFSTYRLRLVRGDGDDQPRKDFDPRLSEVEFSFKVECPSDFDCKPVRVCPEAPETLPDIDYLVKDYASFRRLMLDRLSQLVPGWRERTAADLGVTLTELLAYVGDQLSYWQDAIATEAYIGTARRRTSLRRHALLVDYHVSEGCNARAWLQVEVAGGPVDLKKDALRFHTRTPGVQDRIAPGSREEGEASSQSPVVFEAMHDAVLFEAHNEIDFYTWMDERCCLNRGATRATLRDPPEEHLRLRLRRGDVLIFEERLGPGTGLAQDANPSQRHALRLTRVHPEAEQILDADGREIDRAPGSLVWDPLTLGTDAEQAVVEIEWAAEDAVPFPLCLSSRTDESHGSEPLDRVSVALGNVVLVDHGLTVEGESLGPVPEPRLHYPADRDAGHCDSPERKPVLPRFRPRLAKGPLTRTGSVLKLVVEDGVARSKRVGFDPDAPAVEAMRWRTPDAMPDIRLDPETEEWEPRRDLLDSAANDGHFVVEAEHDGIAWLRFGDDTHGRRPDEGEAFTATYRVGNGIAGNVGAEAIAHVVSDDTRIRSVRNPMPATGGTAPESAAQVRRRAPQAFRTQERAVTPQDYAEVTQRHPGVQRAATTPRWTGSWHTMFVTVDRAGGELLDAPYSRSLHAHVDRYRTAGHDVRFDDPAYVSLEIELLVCVAPDYFRPHVRSGLLAVLGNADLPDGRRGVFHPGELSFGQTIYLSPILAAARAVPGVASVQATRFHRQGREDSKPLVDGFMQLGRLEIPRLDNDPNFPEHGVLRLDLRGGK